jgi:hypothetical protein
VATEITGIAGVQEITGAAGVQVVVEVVEITGVQVET